MCDRANHDSCEIVYDLQLNNEDLKSEVEDLEMENVRLKEELYNHLNKIYPGEFVG